MHLTAELYALTRLKERCNVVFATNKNRLNLSILLKSKRFRILEFVTGCSTPGYVGTEVSFKSGHFGDHRLFAGKPTSGTG
jgi:hypothetical protein